MAATKYTYSIANDTANGIVNVDSLTQEVNAAAIAEDVDHINTVGDVLDIWFPNALSAGDQTTLTNTVAAHTGEPPLPDVDTTGGSTVRPLSSPSAPTVAAQGTTGSTSWGYKIAACSNSGETMCSSETTISDGNATLSSTNFNRVSWTAVAGAVEYKVYRSTAGGTPSTTGLIKSTVLLTFDDKGVAASGSEPSEDNSGTLVIGTGDAPANKVLTVREETSATSTVTSLINVSRKSTGTVAAGFGSGIYVALEDAGGTVRSSGSLHFLWADPAAGTLDCDFRIMLRDGGSGTTEFFRVTADGELKLKTVEVLAIGTCVIQMPVDGGVRGGTTSASTNNDVAAIKYDTGTDGWNRYNLRPPQNYTSGNLTFRLICSVPSAVAATKGTRWKLEWSCKSLSDALGSWASSSEFTYDISSQAADTLFAIDFTVGSATFDKTDDMFAFKVTRVGTNGADDCGVDIYVHGMELQYTGYKLAGQPGQ
jgi:hypothetical protein